MHRITTEDEGFGLVEIVVSMFMLAILAMAFLPILVQGLKQSSSNATLATATQLVNQQLQKAQAKGPQCTLVESVAGMQQLTDPQGVEIQVTTSVGACPTAVGGTVSVTVSAVRQDSGDTVASASTLVYVKHD
ncbi:hypothetical protein GCM10009840_12070 [Pseudolysinimonas kribbensis]|nr:type II secretion system protein [Pseudolysinimonas kribbensis]